MSHGRISMESFSSHCLKRNPLKDPHVREVPVYVPPGYEQSRKRYPVVYWLTGFSGRGRMLLNRSAFGEGIDERLDRLIASKKISPMIVVMPDCFTRYGGSQYLDSTATGRYETHIIQELIPYIDKKYRTLREPSQRAVMGKSSGGFGAIVLAMRHPDVFGVTICHSGDMAFEYCYLPDFPQAMIELEKHKTVQKYLDAFYKKPKKSMEDLLTLNVIAMAACYSPNPKTKPHLFDLPFDEKTGQLRADVWKRWLAWDPVRMVERHKQALRRLKIFLDCGTKDEFRLYAGARIFSSELKKLRIQHVYEEFEDTHMDIAYRYDRSLQFISQAFKS
jgi:enterochelin esterase family protein